MAKVVGTAIFKAFTTEERSPASKSLDSVSQTEEGCGGGVVFKKKFKKIVIVR